MDVSYLVKQIKAVPQGLRLRLAKAITVNTDQTVDIQIAGDESTLPSVKYLSTVAPKPNDQLWVLSSGSDLLGIGMVADTDRTLAPVAYKTSSQTILKDTPTAVIFDGERNNGWNCWNVSNPTRLTAPLTGVYQVTASIYCEANSNVDVKISVKKNNSLTVIQQNVTTKASASGFKGMVTSTPISLTKGDYIEMIFEHDFNPSMTIIADATAYLNAMGLIYLGS